MAIYGLSYSVLGSAQSALLTVMLPAELLPDANGALRTVQESLRLVGPLTGAALFIAVGAHAVAVIDAASFAVPVLTLLALRVHEPAPAPMAHHWRHEVVAGIRHVYRTVELRHVVIAGAVSTTVFGFAETITYAIAGNGLHERPAFVGVLVAVQGVGAVIGGPTAAPLVRRVGEGRVIGIALVIAGSAALLEMPAAIGAGRRRLHPLRHGDPMARCRAHQPDPTADAGRTPGTCILRGGHADHYATDHVDRTWCRPHRRHRLPAAARSHGGGHGACRRLPPHPARAAPRASMAAG